MEAPVKSSGVRTAGKSQATMQGKLCPLPDLSQPQDVRPHFWPVVRQI